jgi:sugar lactone lactonase YvrE
MKTRPIVDTSVEVARIKDRVYYHNISIAFDGRHYFTLNGGNEGYCVLNRFDGSGKVIDTYDVELDGRAIFHNPVDGELYIKDYGIDLYRFDPDDGDVDVVLEGFFVDDNSSPGMSPDGKHIYELVDGEVLVYDTETGEEVRAIDIDEYYDEHGYSASLAVSKNHLFVWGDAYDILVYSMKGKLLGRFALPRQGFSYSLSYCRGMVWIADDADAKDELGDGFWFGYRARD